MTHIISRLTAKNWDHLRKPMLCDRLWANFMFLIDTHNSLMAGTRRNIHPLTPILIVKHSYQLPPSTTIHSVLLVQFACLTVLFHNLCQGPLWSISWYGTLYLSNNKLLLTDIRNWQSVLTISDHHHCKELLYTANRLCYSNSVSCWY